MSIALPDTPAPPTAAKSAWPGMPYRGLDFFREQDAPLFVERERDAEICGARLTHSTTRLLLIQGTTGAGKTSFLRAALCPWLADTDEFWVLRDAQGLPDVLRCTDAPLERLRATLQAAIQAQDSPLRRLLRRRTEALEAAAAALRVPMLDPAALAEGVEQALREITAVLPRTLVLVLDQAEEVFTLRPGTEGDPQRRGFFRMLRQLCRFGAGLRVVLSLRTEFFGQFCDAFGPLPDSDVSTVLSGYQQYRLQGLASEDQLIAAIKRPTENAEVPGFEALGRPCDYYRFTYDEGVAEKIAADVRCYSERERVGALPVLQVVCLELWTHLPKAADGRAQGTNLCVTMEDYRALGEVTNAIERHIGAGIAAALGECATPAGHGGTRRWWTNVLRRRSSHNADTSKVESSAAVERWKYALSRLAAEQDGGATASLVLRVPDLLEAAEEAGLRQPCAGMLAALAREPAPLLRRIGQGDPPRYSLRHDVVAVCLVRFRPGFAVRMRQRQSRAWYRWSILVLVLALVSASFGVLALTYSGRQQLVARIVEFDKVDASGGYRLRLLLLLKALDAAGLRGRPDEVGFWPRRVDDLVRPLIRGEDKLRQALTGALLQAPLPEPDLRAAGVDDQGRDLVRYMEQDDRAWLEIQRADGRSEFVCDVERLGRAGFVGPAAGFLESGAASVPAVVDMPEQRPNAPLTIRVQMCRDSTKTGGQGLLDTLLPGFREANAPPLRLNIAGGKVRITQFTMRSGGGVEKEKLAELNIVDAEGSLTIRAWGPVNLTSNDTNMAVIASCGRYGSVEHGTIGPGSAGKPVVLGNLRADQAAERLPFEAGRRSPSLDAAPESLAFTSDCRWLAVRRAQQVSNEGTQHCEQQGRDEPALREAQQERDKIALRVFDLSSLNNADGPKFHDVVLPAELQRVVRPRWEGFRPLHALEAKDSAFRLAWHVPEVAACTPQQPASTEAMYSQEESGLRRPGLAVASWQAPQPGGGAGPLHARPLESARILAAGVGGQGFVSRLFFAGNGDFLITEDVYFGQKPASRVRLWDLRFTERRQKLLGDADAELPAIGLSELRKLACSVAATDPEGNQLTLSERVSWFADKDTPQPCK